MGDEATAGQPQAPTDGTYFAAFLSYSHADEAVASRLHRRLETYRLPPKVRDAGSDRRIGKIFRDRADFAAANNLTDAIRDALASAQALIVLCSPDARRSPWVDAEIRLFRDLQPDSPVIAVILRGDPSDAMPAALLDDGREPLAADFRRESDGYKLGFLKIVAALKRVPLDSLIQRDAQRNQRRVIVITVLVGAALLFMVAMTALAISARREADRQRAESEGMVEYLITDLRRELIGVGRIDVQQAVNDRALTYYRRQGNVDALPSDSLERRARVLQAMGEAELSRNNVARAATLLDAAFASTSILLDRDPNNANRIFAHAQSEYWRGKVSGARENRPAYVAAMWRYLSLAERLKRIEPDSLRAYREIGYAESNLCSISASIEPLDQASILRHCRNAIAAKQHALAMDPADPVMTADVANQLSWNGTAMQRIGRVAEALNNANGAVALAHQLLRRDRANRDSQDLFGAMLGSRGEVLIQLGQHGQANDDLRRAVQIFRDLHTFDVANERWQRLFDRFNAARVNDSNRGGS